MAKLSQKAANAFKMASILYCFHSLNVKPILANSSNNYKIIVRKICKYHHTHIRLASLKISKYEMCCSHFGAIMRASGLLQNMANLWALQRKFQTIEFSCVFVYFLRCMWICEVRRHTFHIIYCTMSVAQKPNSLLICFSNISESIYKAPTFNIFYQILKL